MTTSRIHGRQHVEQHEESDENFFTCFFSINALYFSFVAKHSAGKIYNSSINPFKSARNVVFIRNLKFFRHSNTYNPCHRDAWYITQLEDLEIKLI